MPLKQMISRIKLLISSKLRFFARLSPSQHNYEVWFQVFLFADVPTLRKLGRTCRLFQKILHKSSVFWIQRAVKDNIEDILPPVKWRQAAKHNNFKREITEGLDCRNISVEETDSFKFDYRKMVLSQRGYAPFKPFDINREHPKCQKGVKFYEYGGVTVIEKNENGCEVDCFSIAHRRSGIACRIDLSKFGIDHWVLYHVRPTIRIKQKMTCSHLHDVTCVVTAHLCKLPEMRKENQREHPSRMNYYSNRSQKKTWKISEEPRAWETMTFDFNEYLALRQYLEIYTHADIAGSDGANTLDLRVGELEIQVILPDEPAIMSYCKIFEREDE